jgi:adenylyltransferase/sulfurtransferase
MTIPPADRFRRQLQLSEVGPAGQARLGAASTLVVGAGGLGCAVLPYLVGAGLGAVVVCDGDMVEPSNLPRQVLYGDDDVGRAKAAAAVARLAPLNRACLLTAVAEPVGAHNVGALVAAADVVIDATDNFAARYLLHDACFAHGRPLVSAAVHHDEGQLAVFRFDRAAAGPCWRCLWPQPPAAADCDGGCRDHGILGPVPGVLGALQADQALRVLLEASPLAQGRLVHVDLASLEIWRTAWTASGDCALCGAGKTARPGLAVSGAGRRPPFDPFAGSVADEETGWEALDAPADCLWVDARSDGEQAYDPAPAALAGLPIISWRAFGHAGPPPDRPCVVFCAHGIRSLALTRHWRTAGCGRVRSLRGGLAAQRRPRT